MKKNSNSKLDALFGNKRFTAIFSFVMAVLVWLVVITVINPDTTRKISVPVDFTYNSASYINQGLDIVIKPINNLTVVVKGDGSVVGGLSASDLQVYPDYSSVKGPGEYSLRLELKKTDPTKNFEVESPVEQIVNISFDKMVTQKFTVTTNISGVQPADGYYMDLATASPTEVTLRGPEKEMKRVVKVTADVEMNEVRTESAIVTTKLNYLDANGDAIVDTYITSDADQVEINIPVLKVRELPLVLEYASVPAGYDPAQLGAKLSADKIRVAGPAAQVDALDKISAGYIDLKQFQLGESKVLPIQLAEGLRNIDNLQEVTVTFDTTGYSTKTVSVSELRAINVPAGVTVNFPTGHVNNVVLVGKQQELDALTATGVIAQVDASPANLAVSKGQQNMPVQILVPAAKSVFAVGSYTALCDIITQNAQAAANAAG